MALNEVHTVFDFRFNAGRLAAIERGVGRTTTRLSTTAKSAEMFQTRVAGAMKRAGQMLLAFGAYRALKVFTSDYATAADNAIKFSAAIGISTRSYQGLAHAVQINGATVENLNKALPQLAQRAGEAADGNKTYAREFRRLGVDVTDASGKLKSADKLFLEVADGMKNMKDENRRTQVSMKLLGRTGATLNNTFMQGSEGIKKLIAEAEKLGVIMSKEQLQAAEKYKDAMLRLKQVTIGIRNELASKLIPTITKQVERFTRWWREGNNAERTLRRLKQAAIFTGIAVGFMITTSVIRKITLFVKGVWAGVTALRAMGTASLAAAWKVGLVVAAMAAVYLIVEDLVYFAQGKDSLIGRLLGDSKLADDLRKSLIDMAKAAKDAWAEIGPALAQSWEELKPALGELGAAIKPLIGPTFRAAVKMMVIQFQSLAFAIRVTADLIKNQITAWKGFVIGAKAVVKVLLFIKQSMTDISHAATSAASAIAAVTGRGKAGSALGAGATAFQKAGAGVTTGSVIARQRAALPGVMRPAHMLPPVAATVGGPLAAGSQSTVNTNVASGAFAITIHAAGDASAIASEVNTQLTRNLKQVFTRASRDLKKPPAGQQ